MTTEAIYTEVQKLAPSALIELFVLDLTDLGGDITRFHAGTNGLSQNVIWQGEEYTRFPVQASGFEMQANASLPRPKMSVSNVFGTITSLLLVYNDMIGAKVTRKRTLAKYLDAVNFALSVNATADDTAEFNDDVFYIDRKVGEGPEQVDFELAAAMDFQGLQLPRRQIIQNICPWKYRGPECSYTGDAYFNTNDEPVPLLVEDRCGKRLSSCKLRFGETNELTYGGFPAAGLIR